MSFCFVYRICFSFYDDELHITFILCHISIFRLNFNPSCLPSIFKGNIYPIFNFAKYKKKKYFQILTLFQYSNILHSQEYLFFEYLSLPQSSAKLANSQSYFHVSFHESKQNKNNRYKLISSTTNACLENASFSNLFPVVCHAERLSLPNIRRCSLIANAAQRTFSSAFSRSNGLEYPFNVSLLRDETRIQRSCNIT